MGISINKNGIVTSEAFDQYYTLPDGSMWLPIFYHNNRSGTVLFTSLDEVLNTNSTFKKSKLYLLKQGAFKYGGVYEFLLRYPMNSSGYNRWKQTNSPTEEHNSAETVAGYSAVHIDFSGNAWGGLHRLSSDTSSISPCYLAGSQGEHGWWWWYAIGASQVYNGGIPGANDVICTQDVILYARVDGHTKIHKTINEISSMNIIEY